MSKKFRSGLKGGEVLQKSIGDNMPQAMIDPRYYPIRSKLQQNISTEYAEYQKHPVKNINSNIHEWEVDKASSGFIDLSNSYIVVRHKILDKDGEDISNTAVGAYKQNLSLLLYKDKKTYVNNREVNDQHDIGLSAYSDFHKICLMEEHSEAPSLALDKHFVNNLATVDEGEIRLNVKGDRRSFYEDIYDLGSENLGLSYDKQAILTTKAIMYDRFNCYTTGVQTVVRPRDGVWQSGYFLPPDTQLRLRFTVTEDEKILTSGILDPQNKFLEADLYLRRVYPTAETMASIAQLALSTPRIYPIVHNRCTYFTLPSGSTTITKTGLLSGAKPSVLVVQFVKAANFINNLNGNYSGHPFNADQFRTNNAGTFQDPKVSVGSLYVKVGSKRYPKNYELGSESNNLGMNAVEYDEYVRSCHSSDGTKVMKPFLGPSSRATKCFFINTRENNETMWDKVDEPTGLDSIELQCRLNSATTEDIVVVVSALSNSAIVLSPDGNVNTLH